MKQYCRYCVHLHTGNGIWCDAKEFTMPESIAKGVNTCKLFDFCEIDAFGETAGYKPRQPKQTVIDEIGENQLRLEEPV